jgi:quercetin dioxygenase-like cupin family protein
VKVRNSREVEADTEVPGVALRTVITADDAPRFSMRVFEVAVGGSTPYHTHDWEHEVFIVSGRGEVRGRDGRLELVPDHAVFVEPGEEHCFTNTGDEIFRFICCIPHASQLEPKGPPSACEG